MTQDARDDRLLGDGGDEPEQVRKRLAALVDMGANHLLLNPVTRYAEQVEALVEVVGLA